MLMHMNMTRSFALSTPKEIGYVSELGESFSVKRNPYKHNKTKQKGK